MSPLLLVLLMASPGQAVQVSRAPNGAEIIRWHQGAPAWTEARIAIRPPAGPPALGVLLVSLLQVKLRANQETGPTADVRYTPSGIVIGGGAPPESVVAVVHTLLETLSPQDILPDEMASARRTAALILTRMQRDDDSLLHRFLGSVIAGSSTLGADLERTEKTSAGELLSYWRRTLQAARVSFIFTGASPPSLLDADWPAFDTFTSSASFALAPATFSTPLRASIDILVIDQPDRSRATLRMGWRPSAPRSEAVTTIASRMLGPGGGWRAPFVTVTATASIGDEVGRLRDMQLALEQARGETRGTRWRSAVATTTRSIALELADPLRAADALALDRLTHGRTLRPVLIEQVAAQQNRPARLGGLFDGERRVMLVLTTMRSALLAKLARRFPNARISVTAWDH